MNTKKIGPISCIESRDYHQAELLKKARFLESALKDAMQLYTKKEEACGSQLFQSSGSSGFFQSSIYACTVLVCCTLFCCGPLKPAFGELRISAVCRLFRHRNASLIISTAGKLYTIRPIEPCFMLLIVTATCPTIFGSAANDLGCPCLHFGLHEIWLSQLEVEIASHDFWLQFFLNRWTRHIHSEGRVEREEREYAEFGWAGIWVRHASRGTLSAQFGSHAR